MKLTVLGKWSPYPLPGGACPGYLAQAGGVRVLLDCGNGVVAALQRFCSPADLAAAVITHLHPDHFSDIYALQNALRFGRYPKPAAPPLRIFAPRGADQFLAAVLPKETSRREFLDRFTFSAFEDGEGRVGEEVRLRFAPTNHPMPCHAVEVSSGGRRLVYTADTGPSEAVERLAAGAHMLLAECTLAEGTEHLAEELGHLTGGMAGALAARVGAKKLLLTHFFAPFHAVKDSVAAAAKEIGAVSQVDEGSTYEV